MGAPLSTGAVQAIENELGVTLVHADGCAGVAGNDGSVVHVLLENAEQPATLHACTDTE